MSSDEKKMEGADKPAEDDGAKKAVADTDDDEDRVCGFESGTEYFQRPGATITECQNNQGVREIASTACPRRRILMFNESLHPVVFDLGNQSRPFRVRLQNKHSFDIVSPDLWCSCARAVLFTSFSWKSLLTTVGVA